MNVSRPCADWKFLLAAVGLLAAGWQASGQQVLAPPPLDFSGMSPALRTTGTNQPGALPAEVAPASPDQPLLTLGPVQFRPHLMYRFIYGDGIPAAPGDQVKTAINEFYPGILIALGNYWHLDYTPIARFYSSSRFRDSLDHSVSLTGGTTFEDWTLGLSQSYNSSSQPLIQTGTQTDQENFDTRLNAAYHINTAVSLELGASQAFRLMGGNSAGEQLTDSRTWSTMDWLNYQFSQAIGAAIGVGFAYDNVSVGTDMTSEQLQGRLTWRPGQKLFVTASAGFEDRQFLDVKAPDALNPIFGVSASYQVFERTSVSLGANRTVSASYFENQITVADSITAGLRQRLFGKLQLDLTGGYSQTTYQIPVRTVRVARQDSSTFFSARLSVPVLRRATLAVFYQQTENSSSDSGFALSSSQGGLEVGYRF